MSELDDAQARRSEDRIDAGRERFFLIFRAGPMAIVPIGAGALLVFLTTISGQYYRLWGLAVLALSLYCFAKAFTERLPRTQAVLEGRAAHDAQGRNWVVYGWLLSLAGFVGPIVLGIPALNS